MSNNNTPLLNMVWEAAQQHGLDSDPDHEVGDLQDALRECFNLLTKEQCGVVLGRLELWGDDEEETDIDEPAVWGE